MLKKPTLRSRTAATSPAPSVPRRSAHRATMSAQEFDLVLSRLEGYVQYIYLHVMGEPLLHPELTTLFALAKARDMKICITTNGTLLQSVPMSCLPPRACTRSASRSTVLRATTARTSRSFLT